MCRLMEELRMQGRQEGLEEGLEKGMEKGIEKGMEKNRAENAMAMLKDSLPHEAIARYTGLSIERVAELAKQQSA